MIEDKFSSFYKAVYEQQDAKPSPASGWIQWKGTNICIDLYCECGEHGHIDGEFFYYYECSSCHRKFAVGQNVKLIELTKEQAEYAASRHPFLTKEKLENKEELS